MIGTVSSSSVSSIFCPPPPHLKQLYVIFNHRDAWLSWILIRTHLSIYTNKDKIITQWLFDVTRRSSNVTSQKSHIVRGKKNTKLIRIEPTIIYISPLILSIFFLSHDINSFMIINNMRILIHAYFP